MTGAHRGDADETLPGPFEYDVKRMAASFTIAARNNGFSRADARVAAAASAAAYREAMAGFAQMPVMDVWYAYMDEDELMAAVRGVVAQTAKGANDTNRAHLLRPDLRVDAGPGGTPGPAIRSPSPHT